MVLTDGGLTMVNSRQWAPEAVVIANVSAYTIEGWIDKGLAVIRLTGPGGEYVVDHIADSTVAERMTAALRSR
jgi:hypothetical protein